jgi:hypothetical protein
MTPNDWIAHSDSLFHQIFMIFMGGLYALAMLAGVTYKTINIYCYFVFYPATFALFLDSKKKYFALLATLIFFLIPSIQDISEMFFDKCVDFLNYSARIFHSNYIDMSIYWCVIIPLLLYIPFIVWKFEYKKLKKIAFGVLSVIFFYVIFIYPFFKPALMYLMKNYFIV